jgi:tRNA(Ile)-lysidine synthase
MKEKVLETIRAFKMLKAGDRVLVGVSGGIDSTALLHLLSRLKEKLRITLYACHLNHLTRGKESEEDARYAYLLSQSLNIPIRIESYDVLRFAKKRKLSFEEAAREVRYEFYERIAKEVGADKIALGHTADDSVETFLMRLYRGAGQRGLSSIPPVRNASRSDAGGPVRGKIIRPLIRVWRKETEAYCQKYNLEPRLDSSNLNPRFFRNKIRLEIIPKLEKDNPNFKSKILHILEHIREEYLSIEKECQAILPTISSFENGELKISISSLIPFPPSLKTHILRTAIEKIKGDLKEIYAVHISDLLKLLKKASWQLHLPHGLFASKSGDSLILSRKPPEVLKPSFYYSLAIPGETSIPEAGLKIKTKVSHQIPKTFNPSPWRAYLDLEKTGKNLIVRNFKAGDRFRPLGMKGSKKVHDFFIDRKVPQDERYQTAILENREQILGIIGHLIDDRVKVTGKTKRVLKLVAQKI